MDLADATPEASPWSVWFYLTIKRWDGDATVSRHLWMPFHPYQGLRVVFNDENCVFADVHIVEWIAEDSCFWVWCEADDIINERHPSNRCEPLKLAVKWFLENGWERFSENLIDKDDEKRLSEGKKDWRRWRQTVVRNADKNCNPSVRKSRKHKK